MKEVKGSIKESMKTMPRVIHDIKESVVLETHHNGVHVSEIIVSLESLVYIIAKGPSKVIASIFNPHDTRPEIVNHEIEVETSKELW